jgi:hypothetical protein
MAAHAFDRQMGLAGIGRAQNRDQRLCGEARHYNLKMAQASAKASEPALRFRDRQSCHVPRRGTESGWLRLVSAGKGLNSPQLFSVNPRISLTLTNLIHSPTALPAQDRRFRAGMGYFEVSA